MNFKMILKRVHEIQEKGYEEGMDTKHRTSPSDTLAKWAYGGGELRGMAVVVCLCRLWRYVEEAEG